MQRVFAAFATVFARAIRPGSQAAPSRAQRQGVHLLGAVRSHAVLPGGAFELAARSLHGAGRLRIPAEASGPQRHAEEIDLGLCQRQSPVGTLPDGFHAAAGKMSGGGGGARPSQVPLQEQADEPGRQHHRAVGHHVRLGQVPPAKGAIKLHLLLDHDGYLPSFAVVTEGKHSELKVARSLASGSGYDSGHRPRLQRLRVVRAR